MGWLYGAVGDCVQPPMGWLYGAIGDCVQPPVGWLYGASGIACSGDGLVGEAKRPGIARPVLVPGAGAYPARGNQKMSKAASSACCTWVSKLKSSILSMSSTLTHSVAPLRVAWTMPDGGSFLATGVSFNATRM